MAQGGHQKVTVSGDSPQVHAFQGQGQAPGGVAACRAVGHHLGQHRVEVDPDLVALLDPGVPADGRLVGRSPGGQDAGGRKEAGRRVFGVEPSLDGVAGHDDVVLPIAEGLTGRHP